MLILKFMKNNFEAQTIQLTTNNKYTFRKHFSLVIYKSQPTESV